MKKRKVSVYLSAASFLHLLILAFGGGLAAELLNPKSHQVTVSLLIIVVAILLSILGGIYLEIVKRGMSNKK